MQQLKTLGNRIRALRKKKRLSTDYIGAKCGIQGAAVRRWERNETRPTVEDLAILSRILGVRVDEILLGQPDDHHVVTVDIKPGQSISIEVNAAESGGPEVVYHPPIEVSDNRPAAKKKRRKKTA